MNYWKDGVCLHVLSSSIEVRDIAATGRKSLTSS
jgi:hypothetical protein